MNERSHARDLVVDNEIGYRNLNCQGFCDILIEDFSQFKNNYRPMEKKKRSKKKVSNAISQFNKLCKAALSLGFDLQTTLPLAVRNAAIREYVPPKTRRGEVTPYGISFKKDIDGLANYLHIPYNTKTGDFYRVNEAWIIVTDSLPVIKGKRYYREPVRCFGRDFVRNIIFQLRAVEWRIRHRPISKKTKGLMLPFRNKLGAYEFVARKNGRIVERKKFFIGLPDDLQLVTYINKWQSNKIAATKRRNQTGATPMRKIRKPHKVKPVQRSLSATAHRESFSMDI